MIEEIEKMTTLEEVNAYVEENDVEVNLEGLDLADAKQALSDALEAAADADDDEEEEESEETAHKNHWKDGKDYEVKDAKKIASELMKSDRDVDFYKRTIKYVNKITTVEGDNGDYNRVTATLTKAIDGIVAVEGEDGEIEWKPGKQTMLFIMEGSIMATIKNNPELAPYYDSILKDKNMLYTILAGSTVKICAEHVATNEEYVNPFSTRHTVRTYDHDTIMVNIYEIAELGKSAKEWLLMQKLARAGAFSADVVLGMMDRLNK